MQTGRSGATQAICMQMEAKQGAIAQLFLLSVVSGQRSPPS